ncbi:hypothetical protein [Rhizorhabdus sp.]|uniref:hypothetical protein n=1 Tax=Rhizorhabdus sp. TaxID=1968843 RepID=UPI0035B4A13B
MSRKTKIKVLVNVDAELTAEAAEALRSIAHLAADHAEPDFKPSLDAIVRKRFHRGDVPAGGCILITLDDILSQPELACHFDREDHREASTL